MSRFRPFEFQEGSRAWEQLTYRLSEEEVGVESEMPCVLLSRTPITGVVGVLTFG